VVAGGPQVPTFVRHHNHTTLHLEIMMPMPLTVSCFSKIQIGFTFPVPAHLGSPGQSAVKRVCVCVCVWCAEGVASSFLNVAWCGCGVVCLVFGRTLALVGHHGLRGSLYRGLAG